MNMISGPFRILLYLTLIVVVLYFAREILVPLSFGILFAMLLLPLSRRFENTGMNRGIAAFICTLALVAVAAGILLLLEMQFKDLAKDFTGIEKRVESFVSDIRSYVSETFGISVKQQDKMLERQGSSGSGRIATGAATLMGTVFSLAVNTVLALVYIFLVLFFRGHLKKFILKVVPEDQKTRASGIVNKSAGVIQAYLAGMALMIGSLWIMYTIGFSIVGIKHPIFFAILCGTLEIIPFIGNLTGTLITLFMALAQGGGSNIVIGVVLVYLAVQFIQSYILEPLVVGARVNINPLFTIIVLVAGEALWGIAGMVLAIPVFGVVKIVCDNIDELKPYGFLIGGEPRKGDGGLMEKIKKKIKSIKK